MSITLKGRSFSRSKSREKDAKYIPAAIIPSVAFILNPTVSTEAKHFNEPQNNLLSSTLNSSILGLNVMSANQDNVLKEKLVQHKSRKNGSRSGSQEFIDTEVIPTVSLNETDRRKRSKTEDSKRHIEIANGLYKDSPPVDKSIETIEYPSSKMFPDYVSSNTEDGSFIKKMNGHDRIRDSSPRVSWDKNLLKERISSVYFDSKVKNLPSDKQFDMKIKGREHMSIDNLESEKYDNSKRHFSIPKDIIIHRVTSETNINESKSEFPKIGFEQHETEKSHFNKSPVSIGFEGSMRETDSTSHEKIIPFPPKISDSQSYLFEKVKPEAPESSMIWSQSQLKSETHSQGEYKKENPKKITIREMKNEIRGLQLTIYRLNEALSSHFPEGEYGKFIGKTVLPGKGPVPSWLINTRYLTPLVAFYDKRYDDLKLSFEKNQIEVINFQKEINKVIKENERLHLRIQENAKGHGICNQSEIQIIVQQAKLVIEENHLLIEEIELLQQKIQQFENNNFSEVAQIKKALLSVTSERDALDEEIKDLTRRIAELKGSTQPIFSPTPPNPNNQYLNLANDMQKQFERQIKELKTDRVKLEQEIDHLKQNEKKQGKKLEAYKRIIDSEKKYREFFDKVLEKSDEVVNERNTMLEMLEMHLGEMNRLSNKLVAEINCRTNLDSSRLERNTKKEDSKAELSRQLHFIESLMDKFLQYDEDLMNRYKSQENELCRYQILLKEKEKELHECLQGNDILEEKLEKLLINAGSEY